MKWIHSDEEFDEFFEHANDIYPTIKFTHEVSKTKIAFLDATTTVIDIVGMFEKLIKLFIAMYPLHINVIYKPEPCQKLLK
jgi:hypothetical protein